MPAYCAGLDGPILYPAILRPSRLSVIISSGEAGNRNRAASKVLRHNTTFTEPTPFRAKGPGWVSFADALPVSGVQMFNKASWAMDPQKYAASESNG